MKHCVERNPVYGRKHFFLQRVSDRQLIDRYASVYYIEVPGVSFVLEEMCLSRQCRHRSGPEIKKKIMLNSTEHEIFPAHKC